MRVLLYGEFSGVHTNLMNGLIKLGAQVDLVTRGDGFKLFDSTISLRSRGSNILTGSIADAINYLTLKSINKRYDISQFISPRPGIVTAKLGIELDIIKSIINNSKRSFYYHCGCDSNTHDAFLKYNGTHSPEYLGDTKGLCNGCLIDYRTKICPQMTSSGIKHDEIFLDLIDGIITGSKGAYLNNYSSHKKNIGSVGFSINTDWLENDIIEKRGRIPSVIHGTGARYYTKGSDIITRTLNSLKEREKINVNIVHSLPYAKYIETLRSHTVLVDQLYGDELGMNTLSGMAAGMAVITRFDKNRIIDSPASYASNVEELESEIIRCIRLTNSELESLRSDTLDYLKENHCQSKIANDFLRIWGS